MNRRFYQVLATVLAGLIIEAVAGSAFAADKEQEARALRTQAIQQDYLAMKFNDAVEKLEKALDLCTAGGCAPSLVANLHRDLGVVYVAGLEEPEEGKAEFIAALNIDPSLTLDKDLTSEKVEAVFAEVKSAMAEAKAQEKKAAEDKRKAETGGDIQHKPPTEGLVETPLPIFVKLKPGFKATRLKVRYKNDVGDWVSADMKEFGDGYAVELPCKGVGASPRTLEYFIEATVGGDVVGLNGSRTRPHQVAIKTKLEGKAPALPGQPPPAQCLEECPPGACTLKEGEECHEEQDCKEGLLCVEGVCTPPKADLSKQIGKRLWVSAAFQQDFMLLTPLKDVCNGDNAYKCYWADKSFYAPAPDLGKGDRIGSAGFGASTSRVLVGAEYFLLPRISVGGRLGYAFGGGPEGFIPVHVEARAAYWFWPRSVTAGFYQFLPYVALSAGLGEVDSHIKVKVVQSVADKGVPPCSPEQISATCPTGRYTLTAWRKGGPVFASLGLGMLHQLGSMLGVYLEARLSEVFPSTVATVMSLQGGATVGLF